MTNLLKGNVANAESPFTELFALLKRYERLSEGDLTLAYQSDELKVMHQHIDNAIETLLQGLQDLGQMMSMAAAQDNVIEELNTIGSFISVISNLTEALNNLRLDAGQVLRERGIA